MVHDDKSVFGSGVSGKSNEEIKMDINNLGEMKGKDIGNPSLATNKAKSKNNGKDNYNKCDGDPIAQTQGILSTMKMSFALVFTFGLAIIISKTGVEGRRLEENSLDSTLRGVQGKEYVLADNKVVFSSISAGGSNEEAKKDINSTPGEKKVKAVEDASPGYHFGATKDAEDGKMFAVSTMSRTRPTDNLPHHNLSDSAKRP
ncbi:hypothetical protein C4D60_Mb08t12680 [Musa balbisiana]|uniref:Uncharacterized protein n=1 Tax=Musa balbisiana TaxID=52838 RepID=A0A4S8K3B0_MUSBA|nr:hypothetical protein C4D60_Mb08t12680 [Musa balbisiana]